jgi:hypothetical protein
LVKYDVLLRLGIATPILGVDMLILISIPYDWGIPKKSLTITIVTVSLQCKTVHYLYKLIDTVKPIACLYLDHYLQLSFTVTGRRRKKRQNKQESSVARWN